jgi:hypothetical protein
MPSHKKEYSVMSNSGFTLLVIAAGVGGYALYRWSKKSSHHVGASPCGPYSYWDDQSKSCVPLTFPEPSTGRPVQCPPGQFYDYFRGACVPSTLHATGFHGHPQMHGHHGMHDMQQQMQQQMQQMQQGMQGDMDPSMQQADQGQQPYFPPHGFGSHSYGQHGFRGRR